MKQLLFWLLLLPLPAFAGEWLEFDTAKILSKRELEIAATVEELRQALIDLRFAEREKRQDDMLEGCLKIGRIYSREHYYPKALLYFRRAAELAKTAGSDDKWLSITTLVAETLLENNQPLEAFEAFSQVCSEHETAGRYEETVHALQRLADAAAALKNYTKAKECYLKINALAQAKSDLASQATALNNLGFLSNKAGNFEEAVGFFKQAEILAGATQAMKPDYLFTNLGIAFNNLGESAKAVENLKKAEAYESAEKSYVQHLVATIYLKNKDIYNALRYNETAVKSARKSQNASVLCDAYDVASEIYQQLFEYDKALDFYKKHLALKDSLVREERLRQQELDNLHALLERSENALLQDLSDNEVKQLTISKLELANTTLMLEKEKQDLEAAQRQKELDLAQERQRTAEANQRSAELQARQTQQALLLRTKELLAARQQQEIDNLGKQNELDSLQAAQQAAEQQYQISQLETQKRLKDLEISQQEQKLHGAYRLGGLLAALMLLVFGSWLYGRRLNRRLATEKKRAEGLLLNILPKEVAQELKTKGAATPQRYESVSVVFTDFASFTKISNNLPPEEILKELNACFTAFDDICERHRLEKIKTIGDAYMCAGGIPIKNTTHASDAVAAAREMIDFVKKRNSEHAGSNRPEWHIRIGVHTGEVVAGVVGSKKFAYDIWGDTVNVASRMESNCPTDSVNISEATYELVNHRFTCEFRGKVEVKNRGKMGMYLVKG
jgi:class 3 adenylate cyclase